MRLMTEAEAANVQCRIGGRPQGIQGGMFDAGEWPTCDGARCGHWDWYDTKGGKRRRGRCGLVTEVMPLEEVVEVRSEPKADSAPDIAPAGK